MACFSPLQGYRSKVITKNGKRKVVFSVDMAIDTSRLFQVTVPCGQCVGCRLERSRQWAIRCMHEAQMYNSNCFISLTYATQHLPRNGSLEVRDFQLFMKRLRKRLGSGIRFYHCGEYGAKHGRPHYHACLFNYDFPDKVLFKEDNGNKLYRSKILEELWPYGHSSVGSVTFESAAYVARYIMKKVTGDAAAGHYVTVDLDGEILPIKPEYTTMSRRPGIGKSWYETYMSDVFPSDEVVVKGVKMRPPKFYDSQYELSHPDDFELLKVRRKRKASKHKADNTPDRLFVRETCVKAKLKLLPRNIDSEI